MPREGSTRSPKVTAVSDVPGVVSKEQIEENRTSIGSLSWLAKQTRPDLQFSQYPKHNECRQSDPSPEDLMKTNRIVKLATGFKDKGDKGIKIKRISEGKIAFVAFHDAACGHVDTGDPSIDDSSWSGGHPVASQLAHVIVITHKNLMESQEHDFSLIDWRSKSGQRVCRSTFAVETMACCEALEHALYLFFFAKGILISEEVCGEIVFSHCITDCKGLFDHLHREGTPKAPSQEGLAIDLSGLRQILMREALQQFKKEHGANVDPTPDLPCRPPIHWAPTALQMADILTIERNPADWAIIVRVKLLLPRRSKRDQYRTL